MSNRTVIGVAALVLLALAIVALIFLFAPAAPKFIVVNSDAEPVRVVARWRDKTKDLGSIAPGQQVRFTVDGEAAIAFEVIRQNGSGANTGEIYFTSGTTTHVEIRHTGVDVKSDVGG